MHVSMATFFTFIFDIDFTKQTVTIFPFRRGRGGTHPVTWPAEITDRSVQWRTDDHYLLSIDHTTGIITGGVNGEAEDPCMSRG